MNKIGNKSISTLQGSHKTFRREISKALAAILLIIFTSFIAKSKNFILDALKIPKHN